MRRRQREAGQEERLIDDHAEDREAEEPPSVAGLERRGVPLAQHGVEDDRRREHA